VAAESLVLKGKLALRLVGQQINGLNRDARCRGASRRAAAVDRKWVRLCKRLKLRRETVIGRHAKLAFLSQKNQAPLGLAQRGRGLDQCREHRVKIERRAADDLEHVGGRGLLLQRFTQVLRARLNLLEQPHILDGDHGLVGEGLEQLDVMVDERTGLNPRYTDQADRRAAAHQGENSMLRKPRARAMSLI
jgi:hypothetical protein